MDIEIPRKMRYLIDIGHPAHVHYFKNLAKILESKGHKVIITVKNLPPAIALLDTLGFEYIVLPEKADSIFGKVISQIRYDIILLKICLKKKIDIALGVSVTITHLSVISKIKSFVFDDDDDEVQPLFVKWGHPYATELISPDVLRGKQKRDDTVYYPGYHELAYLHPNRFTPDVNVLKEIGLTTNDRFFILRFNAFKAHHDIGVKGLSHEQKKQLISILSEHGKVFITGERELDPEFEPYKLRMDSDKIHSLIAYATMLIGDSQTMTSEAAVLGTPSVRCNSFVGKISYLEEEEQKFGLTYGFKPDQFEELLSKVEELLKNPDLKREWQGRRDIMLKEKIDVTSFWVWFIENYPQSKKNYLLKPGMVVQF
jgi:predicted glycosyltransferase